MVPTGDTGVDVARWIGDHAHPLTTADPAAPLADLEPLGRRAADATVVGLGGSTRLARELNLVKHRALRLLVEEHGFRALALEAEPELGAALDRYVRGRPGGANSSTGSDGSDRSSGSSGSSGSTGSDGGARAALAGAQSFWRIEEFAAVVDWVRRYNAGHAGDPVRVVGIDPPVADPLAHMDALERGLAAHLVRWQEATGHKVVYWGGSGHTASGTTSTGDVPVRRAGSFLRERYGPGYLSVGLTFDHGEAPYPVPPPSPSLADAVLGRTGLGAWLLDLGAAVSSSAPVADAVRAWLQAPARARLIGPRYDPEDDAAFHMAGGSLAEWFDVIVHWQEVTPVRPLPEGVTD